MYSWPQERTGKRGERPGGTPTCMTLPLGVYLDMASTRGREPSVPLLPSRPSARLWLLGWVPAGALSFLSYGLHPLLYWMVRPVRLICASRLICSDPYVHPPQLFRATHAVPNMREAFPAFTASPFTATPPVHCPRWPDSASRHAAGAMHSTGHCAPPPPKQSRCFLSLSRLVVSHARRSCSGDVSRAGLVGFDFAGRPTPCAGRSHSTSVTAQL